MVSPAQSPRLSSHFSSAAQSTSGTSNISAGVTRSRTLLFLSYRESSLPRQHFKRSKGKGRAIGNGYGHGSFGGRYRDDDAGEEQERLMGNGDDVVLDMGRSAALPPEWVDISERVEEIVEQARTKINRLDKLHAKHVLPGFKDRTAEEREIEVLTRDITSDFRRCHTMIQRVGEMAKKRKQAGNDTADKDGRLAANVQIALANKVQELSSGFRKKQAIYLRQLKGHEIKKQDLVSSTAPVGRETSASDLEKDLELSRTSLASQSLVLVDDDTDAISRRDHEITEIAQSISDLADLFKDLSALVIDQGTLLDRIDYNVEQMSSHMADAVEELKVASSYQRRTGKRRIIILLLLLIFGAILILIYKPRQSPVTPSPPFNESPPDTTLLSSAADSYYSHHSLVPDALESPPPDHITNGDDRPPSSSHDDDKDARSPSPLPRLLTQENSPASRFLSGQRGVALRVGSGEPSDEQKIAPVRMAERTRLKPDGPSHARPPE